MSDNIVSLTAQGQDVFYYGDSFLYIGYLDEAQLSWLEQDLNAVEKGGTVIVGMHIPAIYGDSRDAGQQDKMRNEVLNNRALFGILAGYNVFELHEKRPVRNNVVYEKQFLPFFAYQFA